MKEIPNNHPDIPDQSLKQEPAGLLLVGITNSAQVHASFTMTTNPKYNTPHMLYTYD